MLTFDNKMVLLFVSASNTIYQLVLAASSLPVLQLLISFANL